MVVTNGGAFFGELQRDGAANPAAGTGDDGGFMRQVLAHFGGVMAERMKWARSVLDFFRSARLRYIMWPAV